MLLALHPFQSGKAWGQRSTSPVHSPHLCHCKKQPQATLGPEDLVNPGALTV